MKAVYTAEDIKGVLGPVAVAVPLGEIANGMGVRNPLAEGKVRFYGDPVAVVVADDRYTARDARDLIEVDYEPLPAVVDTEKAMQPGAPLLYEQFGTNVPFGMHPPTDDIDKVFAQTLADGGMVVKQRLVNQRLAPVAMETRGTVAEMRKADKTLTVWSSSQNPHLLRNILCGQIGLPQHQVRVIVPEVGGGFGSKINIYPEEPLVAFAAMKTGHPVKWIEDRSENMAVTIHGRDQVDYAEIAATRDGKITGLKIYGISDMGAYSQLLTDVIMIALGFPVATGAYDIPNVHLSADLVFTNKAPTDAYRGAGRPEATYIIERMMDLTARELGMDPAEIRRRNFLKPDQFPYKSPAGAVYDSGNYEPALDKALSLAGYQELRAEQARRRAAGNGKLMGIGISSYIEACGIGPKGSLPVGLFESARVRIEYSGTVLVYTGSSPHGQGEETTFSQIVADEFGIPMENILIMHGDTDSTPEGRGTYGSRTTAVGGTALYVAAQRLKEKMKTIAAHLLEASVSDVVFEDGKFSVAGSPQKSITFNEVAMAANFSNRRQLNPMLVEGQVHGGLAQGIGQAMTEEVIYGDDGQLLTATLMDYAMPLAPELPHYETDSTVTLTPINPLGVKGVGEAGTIGSTSAVVNAICDALGVAHIDTPFTSEKLWKVIHQK